MCQNGKEQHAPDILYEQGPCLVVYKPSGLLTQAPPGIDSLERRVKNFLIRRENKPGKAYLGVPHRLDRPVSGPVLLAKHVRAAKRLSEQFHDRTVRKIYWACVSGQVEPEQGRWQDAMRKIEGQPQAEIVAEDDPTGKLAVLDYRILARHEWGTWLEVELATGRMHQIRLQAATRGFPILGDALYGSDVPFGKQHDDQRLRAIALHGRTLAFTHPMSREPVEITCDPPPAWNPLRNG